MTRAVVFLAIAFCAAGAFAQQLYRWIDESGRVHVTDTPPPKGARDIQRSKPRAVPADPPGGSQQTPYELSLAMKDYPVSLYTAPMCKEPCQRARDHLNKRGVPFREVVVWDVGSNEELKRVSGSNQVPTMLIGGSVQQGYEPGAFDALLDSARYPKAGAVPARSQPAPPVPDGYTPPDAEPPKAQPVKPAEEKPRGPYAPR